MKMRRMKMKINFEHIYKELEKDFVGNQKKLNVSSALKVYYGISADGNFRISFLSTTLPPSFESTKSLKISQGQESESVYWTCFDLMNSSAKQVFYALCEDLVDSIDLETDESIALRSLKNRYYSWKLMFKKQIPSFSEEAAKGLFGELYFLINYMSKKYSLDVAIDSWSGPEGTSKDFSHNADWFEIKAVSSTAISVNISSISQLSSKKPGYLGIIKIEKMSEQYKDGQSSISELFKNIMLKITSDETKERFIAKLVAYGFDMTDESFQLKFQVIDMQLYLVDNNFPRLLEENIKFQEISKVKYELIIKTLDKYKVV